MKKESPPQEPREKEFFRLAEKFRSGQDPEAVRRLGGEMGASCSVRNTTEGLELRTQRDQELAAITSVPQVIDF